MTSRSQYPNCFLIEQLMMNMQTNNNDSYKNNMNSIPVSLQIILNNNSEQQPITPLSQSSQSSQSPSLASSEYQPSSSSSSLPLPDQHSHLHSHSQSQFHFHPHSHPATLPHLSHQSCTKHKHTKGEFYQPQYPWIRYCQGCALNLALCGKKIQKQLTSQQMFNKITLSQKLKNINTLIKQCQSENKSYSILSSIMHDYRQQYVKVLTQIDDYVKQIVQIRNQLQQSIQNSINKQIKQICQKQTNIISQKMLLIKQKSLIQCGFVQLISGGSTNDNNINNNTNSKDQSNNQQPSSVQQIISRCQQICQQTNLLLTVNNNNKQLHEQFIYKLNQNINQMDKLFGEKISNIFNNKYNSEIGCFEKQNFSSSNSSINCGKKSLFEIKKDRFINDLNEEWSKVRTKKLQKQLQSKILVTNPSSSEKQLAPSHSGFINTSYSTIQHSAFISPCCELNNVSQNILTQQTQNRRTTRAALQLKSRCKSKSGHKRKVDLNVRSNQQNFNKKKQIV